MTSLRKYFVYHFRSTFLRFVIIAVLALLVVSVSVDVYRAYDYSEIADTTIVSIYQQIDISVLNTLALIISTVKQKCTFQMARSIVCFAQARQDR